jgi:hypothetical protein
VVHRDGVHRAQDEAHEGHRYGAADEGRHEPYDELEAGAESR